MTTIYGIKNCDTMKKAFKWLEEHGVEHSFHDYKKSGLDEDAFSKAVKQHGWEEVINRRGTTWRKLPDDVKSNMNETKAVEIAKENPSIVKRPLLVHDNTVYLGFKTETYNDIF